MKRFITLMLAAGLIFSACTNVQAVDTKVSGKFEFSFRSLDNIGFESSSPAGDRYNEFQALQRLRTQFDFIANENLRGVVQLEMGDQQWGNSENGSALGADGKIVEVRFSYIDWNIPEINFKSRTGVQRIKLPNAAFHAHPVFDKDVAALTLSYAFNDNFALTGIWGRPYDGYETAHGYSNEGHDEMDFFALVAPITYDGHEITPLILYSNIGEHGTGPSAVVPNYGKTTDTFTEDVTGYWLGLAYSMTAFDPFVLKMDFIYGSAEGDMENDSFKQKGWLADFKASYALDDVTPAVFGWYGTGDDGKDMGIMPALAGTWATSSFAYQGPSEAYRGDKLFGDSPDGTWGLGIEFTDISFVEDVTHAVRFLYVQGNNDQDEAAVSLMRSRGVLCYMTEEDSLIEVDFINRYQIFENFMVALDLGYMKMEAEDKDGNTQWDKPAYKANLVFAYSF